MEEIIKSKSSKEEEDLFEVIYVGSPTKTVNFAFVNAKKIEYKRELFINEMNNQTISSSLLYKFPLRHLGPDYESFYMVALPCNDLVYRKFGSELEKCDHNKKGILEQSMIKISNDLNGDFTGKGYKSGCRSAIVKYLGKYYRLKGCGNLDKGFNRRHMGFPKGAIDIRGCQFYHTAYREVYMSDRINEIINKFGFEAANKPIGIWLYDEVESQEKGLVNESKKIDKLCSIYQIESEKRLGCQLIPGLEIIVFEFIKHFLNEEQNFCTEEFNKNYKEIVAELFPSTRVVRKNLDHSNEIKEIEPTTSYVPVIEFSREEGDNIHSLFNKYKIYSENEKNYHPYSKDNLINVFQLLNTDHPMLKIFENPLIFKEVITNYLIKNDIYNIFSLINSKSEQLINGIIENIFTALQKQKFKILELICLIFARTAWESGRLKRIMQDNNINWGTYEDQPYRLHCNAHTDNYTINRRGKNPDKNILSILDFDLAFFKENFFNISNETDADKFGFPDDFLFDSYLNMERQHLEWEFAGLENIISFDFYSHELKDEKFKFISNAFFYLLRDTAVIHFRQGYLFKEFSLKDKYTELYENMYDLIELALIISHDFMDKAF